MICVDTSVWIDYLNNFDTAQVAVLEQAMRFAPIVVGDLVLCEVLQGVRSEENAAQIERAMRRFTIVEMLDAEMAIAAARNYRRLRDHGITVRKTIDMIIGTYCIERRYTLLHNDRDFEPMRRYLGLKTL